jgi:hypothetical protein
MAKEKHTHAEDPIDPCLSDLVKGDVTATTVNGCAYGDNPSKEQELFRYIGGGPDCYSITIAKKDWGGNRSGE